ncbi:hypothetical protein [Kocuria aegyptia]
MSQDLRHQADRLAGEEFPAVAPDLIHRGSRLRCLRTVMKDIGARRGRTFDDVEAGRTPRPWALTPAGAWRASSRRPGWSTTSGSTPAWATAS